MHGGLSTVTWAPLLQVAHFLWFLSSEFYSSHHPFLMQMWNCISFSFQLLLIQELGPELILLKVWGEKGCVHRDRVTDNLNTESRPSLVVKHRLENLSPPSLFFLLLPFSLFIPNLNSCLLFKQNSSASPALSQTIMFSPPPAKERKKTLSPSGFKVSIVKIYFFPHQYLSLIIWMRTSNHYIIKSEPLIIEGRELDGRPMFWIPALPFNGCTITLDNWHTVSLSPLCLHQMKLTSTLESNYKNYFSICIQIVQLSTSQ